MSSLDPERIDALLPQTQCTQCGYAGCLPYAQAIAAGRANINQCPPGGDAGIHALAALTGIGYAPLDPAHGAHGPRLVAVIDEARCIGCTICIQKCPVDAIAGAAKVMHTVLADECTGCDLCVAPCPVDCIVLVPAAAAHPAQRSPAAAADTARARYRARLARLALLAERAETRRRERQSAPPTATPATTEATIGSAEHKRSMVAAALARARARRDAASR